MEIKEIKLKMLLDELNLPHEINSVTARILLQKAVYLAQSAGIPMGYRYSWYRFGPYSTELADTYYALPKIIEPSYKEQYCVSDTSKAKLKKVKCLMQKNTTNLNLGDWMELLASVKFLSDIGQDPESADSLIRRQKPRLAGNIGDAKKVLRECGFDDAPSTCSNC